MRAKKSLIFDFGGVLMVTTDYRHRHEWDERLGRPHGTVESIVHGSESWRKAQVGILTPDEYWADIGAQLGLSVAQTRQLRTDFYAGDTVNESLVALILTWRSRGHPIALLSNFSVELEVILRQHHLDVLFDEVVISASIGVMKPDPRAYLKVLNQLNQPPQACVFVDDMLPNVQAAAALGMSAIHYQPQVDIAAYIEPLLMLDEDAHES